MADIDTEYEYAREFTRDVREHEILLSFLSDEGACAFETWWHKEGEKVFRKFVKAQPEDWLR